MLNLAGTFLHVDVGEFEDVDFSRWVAKIEAKSTKIAFQIYGSEIFLDIEIEEGTYFVRFKILCGSLVTIWGLIATYPQFKDGSEVLYEDASKFGSAIIEMLKEITNIDDDKILWKQRRRGDTEVIKTFFKSVSEVEQRGKRLSDEDRQDYAETIRACLYHLKTKAESDVELKPFLEILPIEAIPELPRAPKDITRPRVAMRREVVVAPSAKAVSDMVPSMETRHLTRKRERRRYHNRIALSSRFRGSGDTLLNSQS